MRVPAHLAVAGHLGVDAHLAQRAGSPFHRLFLPDVQHGQPLVNGGNGVIVHVHGSHCGDARAPVHAFHEIGTGIVQVDGSRMHHSGRGGAIHFAQGRAAALRFHHDSHPITGGRAQGNVLRRITFPNPVIATACRARLAHLTQELQEFARHTKGAKVFVPPEGLLEERAAHVGQEDVQVIRLKQHVLWRPAEHEIGMGDDVLVEWGAAGNENARAALVASPRAANLLPCGGNGPWVAYENASAQRADVHPQFQGIGGHHQGNAPLAQPSLNFPACSGQIPGTITPYRVRLHSYLLHGIPQISEEHLHTPPRAHKYHGLNTVTQEMESNAPGFQQHVASQPCGRVEQWGVIEDERAGRLRRRVFADNDRRTPGQPFHHVAWISHRGRGGDEAHVFPAAPFSPGRKPIPLVKGDHPPEAAQDIGHVRAEDAPVRVYLVQNDVTQPAPEVCPAGVVGQDAVVQHIGVGNEQPRGATNAAPGADRCIPVVHARAIWQAQRGEPALKFLALILRQGFCWIEKKTARVGIVQQDLQEQHHIHQTLARRGGGDHHNVMAAEDALNGRGLVGVKGANAGVLRDRAQPRVQERRPRGLPARSRG